MIMSVFQHEFKAHGSVAFGSWVLWYKSHNLWNMESDEVIAFGSLDAAYAYELEGKTIADRIKEADMSLFELTINGGNGNGGPSKHFKFGHASGGSEGDGNFEEKPGLDLPARMNNKIKVKTEQEAIKQFRKMYDGSGQEHGIAIDKNGFVSNYSHGDAISVGIIARNKGEKIIHNHPSGSHFSDADLIGTARSHYERGIVATTPNGYYDFTKGTHFKAEKFARAVRRADLVGKDYDHAVHKWLTKNQKKYGYTYTRYKDKQSRSTKTVKVQELKFDSNGIGSLF